ncbi:MAG: XylR family transcriptional regulator [Verrucomicrobiota bacterium]|jgi:LacI family transcriptional regulator|nr:XylR family transcriptional regulator [Verrucomicrobiota bacterium]
MKGKIAQSEKAFHVALLIETSHEFGREVLRGIRDYARKQRAHWALYLQPDGMRQDVPRMGAWPCSGIIARPFSGAITRFLQNSRLPLVLLDPAPAQLKPPLARAPTITTDTDAIVAVAFDHLRACGCHAFAFVHSSASTVWSDARGQAFAQLAARHGFPCHVYDAPPPQTPWEEDISRLAAWLARLPRGLGVLAAMDQRGRHVIEACQEAGLRVPDDVLVLGVDNDPLLCELCEPSLSSIAMDAHRAGFTAAQTLHALMQGAAVPPDARILVKPTHVSRRQSTASGFDQDPLIANARRYIFARFAERDFQLADIARHCAVSRRLLETRFAQAMGRTLLQELTDVRMERARTLLRDTLDTVTAIAAASGFSAPNYFSKAFRQHHGVSPLRYRGQAREV